MSWPNHSDTATDEEEESYSALPVTATAIDPPSVLSRLGSLSLGVVLVVLVLCLSVTLYTLSLRYLTLITNTPTSVQSLPVRQSSVGGAMGSAMVGTGSEPINLHNLARLVDRLHRGLPVHVTAIGGSNMQGSSLKGSSNTVINVLVEWLNEKFPVNLTSMLAEVTERRAQGLKAQLRLKHVSDNRAVGGTRSAMASYCLDRLLPPCDERMSGNSSEGGECIIPDLLLIDFAINDFIPGNDVTSFSPKVNMERLIRQSLLSLPRTAVVLVHFAAWQRGAMMSAEDMYHEAAVYYHVPEVSIRKFQEHFLYQKEYVLPEAWAVQPDASERLLPDSIPLPLPQYIHDIAPSFVSLEKAIYADAWHLNVNGHLLLTSLLTKKLLGWSANYKRNQKKSLLDPLAIKQPQDTGFVLHQWPNILSKPQGPLPAPLAPELAVVAHAVHFSCTVLYSPYSRSAHTMDLAQAEQFLGVVSNTGWLYGHTERVDKYSFYVSEPSSVGQSLVVDVTHSESITANALILAYVRSWNSSLMGSVECWLSCSRESIAADSRAMTPKQLLNGSWSLPSTQADSTQIWPLEARRESFEGFRTHSREPNCALRYLHVVHHTAGDFRLIGLMYA